VKAIHLYRYNASVICSPTARKELFAHIHALFCFPIFCCTQLSSCFQILNNWNIMANHYDTLKVSRDASLERCKKTYREIQLANHPDKTKHLPEVQRANGEAISKAANVAYEILSDPTRRYMYDETLAPMPGPVPQPQRAPNQQPPTPPTSPPKPPSETYEPKPDHDPNNPPYTRAHHTPGKFTTAVHIKERFELHIALDGAYEPYDWAPNKFSEGEDSITVYMSVRRKELATPNNPDVAVSVRNTPAGRRITKIESFLTQMTAPTGPRMFLRITVFAAANSGGHLRKEILGNRLHNTEFWKFSWNLNPADLECICPSAPEEALVWGKCLILMADEPHQRAVFLPKPEHADNPWGALLRDGGLQRALQPGKKYKLTGSTTWATTHKLEVHGTTMWRIAACAYPATERRRRGRT
jgi:curved DNA-binding protein CbpA